ncbi:MAG: hypothetical protein LBV63_01250 [Candidatus Methanoplasma sp.]|jgi:hypothetical protein|nr:hypothetical protein [Candidatus Methanoplasma sp.]
MSLFDNNRTVGLALIVVGLINLILGIGVAAWEHTASSVAYGIANLIFGVLVLLFGIKVRNGSNDKVAILSGLVRVIGISTILSAIFSAAGAYLADKDLGIGAAIGAVIISIILGLILLWIAAKISGKNVNVISKVIWILLVIIFVLLVLSSIVTFVVALGDIDTATGILSAIAALALIFVYVYALIATISKEVQSSLGI